MPKKIKKSNEDIKKEIKKEINIVKKKSIKFETVFTATDINYLHYLPNFVKSWNLVFPEIFLIIVFIGKEINFPKKYIFYKKYLIFIEPIHGFDTAYLAQNIRLYYPALLNSTGVLITDIDSYPMNRDYYLNVSRYSEYDQFISYRPQWVVGDDQLAMNYILASSETWGKVFKVNNIQDVINKLILHYPLNYGQQSKELIWLKEGWFTDQQLLYNYAKEYDKLVIMDDNITNFNRIDKINMTIAKAKSLTVDIKKGKYSDYMTCRPDQPDYEEINNIIINSLIKDTI